MAQTDKTMEKKIRQVKSWLDKAEQSFAKDSAAKGELHLLLAEAEMRHLKDTKARRWPVYLRRGLHLLTTLIIVGIGWIVYRHAVEIPAMQAVPRQSNMSVPLKEPESGKLPATEVTSSTRETNMVDQGPRVSETETTTTAATVLLEQGAVQKQSNLLWEESTATVQVQMPRSEISSAEKAENTPPQPIMSTHEIQQTVREAGKSLRGQ